MSYRTAPRDHWWRWPAVRLVLWVCAVEAAVAGTILTVLGLLGLAGSPVGSHLGGWPTYDTPEKVRWTALVASIGGAGIFVWRWLLVDGRRMKSMNRHTLDAAYRAAIYRADLPAGRTPIRVGHPTPTLDRLLAETGHATWTFLTAHNPHSHRLPPAENALRHQELADDLTATGLPQFAGEGAPDPDDPDWPADWPPETSLLVLGLPEPAAADLARRYEQNAILHGALGGPARLVWIDADSAATLPTDPPPK